MQNLATFPINIPQVIILLKTVVQTIISVCNLALFSVIKQKMIPKLISKYSVTIKFGVTPTTFVKST